MNKDVILTVFTATVIASASSTILADTRKNYNEEYGSLTHYIEHRFIPKRIVWQKNCTTRVEHQSRPYRDLIVTVFGMF